MSKDDDVFPVDPATCRTEAAPVVAAPASPAPARVKACSCVVCRLRLEALQALPDARFVTSPLHVNLLGIRRQGSINSDQFDDRMAVFFALPDPKADKARLEKAVEAELRKDLEGAVAALKEPRIRVVHCTNGGSTRWVVGLFPISTDPGLVERVEVRSALAKAKKQREEAQAALEDVRKAEAELKKLGEDWAAKVKALTPRKGAPPPRPEELANLKAEVQALQQALAKLHETADGRTRSSALDAAIKWLAQQEERLQKLEAKSPAAAGAGRAAALKDFDAKLKAEEAKQARAAQAGAKSITKLEPGVTSLDAGVVPKRFADFYRGLMQVSEGWAGDGRALFPVGFYPSQFRFGLHHSGEKAQPALEVSAGATDSVFFDGSRVCTGRFFRNFYLSLMSFEGQLPKVKRLQKVGEKKPRVFDDPLPIVEAWSTKDGVRYWLNDGGAVSPLGAEDLVWYPNAARPVNVSAVPASALNAPRRFRVREVRRKGKEPAAIGDAQAVFIVLERTGDGPTVEAWVEEGGKRTRPDDEDQFVVDARIGATNIHRAHGVNVSDKDGSVSVGGEWDPVSNWSVGCQVFPKFADFNLFIRLCAMSKRWRCAAGEGWPPPPAATVDATTRAAQARAASRSAAALEKEAATLKAKLDARTKGITQAQVEAAQRKAKEAREKADAAAQEAKKVEEDDRKLLEGCCRVEKGAGGDAGKGGRQIARLWELDPEKNKTLILKKAGHFMHDWLRVCDLGGWCKVRFDFTLLEFAAGPISEIEERFARAAEGKDVNPRWDGKLLG